jgi:hypothetical protein
LCLATSQTTCHSRRRLPFAARIPPRQDLHPRRRDNKNPMSKYSRPQPQGWTLAADSSTRRRSRKRHAVCADSCDWHENHNCVCDERSDGRSRLWLDSSPLVVSSILVGVGISNQYTAACYCLSGTYDVCIKCERTDVFCCCNLMSYMYEARTSRACISSSRGTREVARCGEKNAAKLAVNDQATSKSRCCCMVDQWCNATERKTSAV